MLLFWFSWFKYRLIKLYLVTVRKICFHFSGVLGSVVDYVSANPNACMVVNHALCGAQNMRTLTEVGTVLKCHQPWMAIYVKINLVSSRRSGVGDERKKKEGKREKKRGRTKARNNQRACKFL